MTLLDLSNGVLRPGPLLCVLIFCSGSVAIASAPAPPTDIFAAFEVDAKLAAKFGPVILMRSCIRPGGNGCDFPRLFVGKDPLQCFQLGFWVDGEKPNDLSQVLAPKIAEVAHTFWKSAPVGVLWPVPVHSIGLTYSDVIEGYVNGPIAATFLTEVANSKTTTVGVLRRMSPRETESLYRATSSIPFCYSQYVSQIQFE